MRAISAVVLGVLLVASPATAGDLRFQAPGEFDAEDFVGQDLQWALLVFKDQAAAGFEFAGNDLAVQNTTLWRPLVVKDPQRGVTPFENPTTSEETLEGPVDVQASFAAGRPGSIFVRARALDLHLLDASGQIRAKHADESLLEAARPDDLAQDLYRIPPVDGAAAVFTAEGKDRSLGFEVSASGVAEITWYSADVRCRMGQPCPPGGGGSVTRLSNVLGAEASMQSHTYITLGGAALGDLVGSGTVDFAIFGASEASAGLTGTVRLPLAQGSVCDGCPDAADRTLELTGTIGLDHLKPAGEPGVLEGSVSGEVTNARLDEQALGPLALAGASSAAAIAGGATVVLVIRWIASFFTRVREPEALGHPKRRLLFDAIRANPGISFNRLLARTGVPSGTARHHLNVLVSLGMVETREFGNALRHFPSGVAPDRQDRMAVLADPLANSILRLVQDNRGARQQSILDLCPGQTRTSVQTRLHRLADAGLILARRSGRVVEYSCPDRLSVPESASTAA